METPKWFRSGFNFIDPGHVPSARVAGQTALGAERAKNVPHDMNADQTFRKSEARGLLMSFDSWNIGPFFTRFISFFFVYPITSRTQAPQVCVVCHFPTCAVVKKWAYKSCSCTMLHAGGGFVSALGRAGSQSYKMRDSSKSQMPTCRMALVRSPGMCWWNVYTKHDEESWIVNMLESQ